MRVWDRSLVPRPFLRTREEFEIRGRRKPGKGAFLRPLISNSSRVRRKGLGTRLVALHGGFYRPSCGSATVLLDSLDSCSLCSPPPLAVEPPSPRLPRGPAHIWQAKERWQPSCYLSQLHSATKVNSHFLSPVNYISLNSSQKTRSSFGSSQFNSQEVAQPKYLFDRCELLTLGAHARGLLYLSCLSVCLCIRLFPL